MAVLLITDFIPYDRDMYTAQETELDQTFSTNEPTSTKKKFGHIDPVFILMCIILLMLGTVIYLLSKPELHFSLTDNWLPGGTTIIETKQNPSTITNLVNTVPTPVASPTPSPTPMLSPVTAVYIP